jgi:hypothetical protein
MKPEKLVRIEPSSNKLKKYDAIFLYPDGQERKVSFGAKGYLDYTIHKDPERKDRYIKRHSATEGHLWRDSPDSPAALSRYVLWEEPTLQTAVLEYRKRFGL